MAASFVQNLSVFGEQSALSSIPDLNTAAGIRMTAGSADAYRRVLHLFATYHDQDIERMTALVEQGDYGGASQIAHGLKGAAGSVGATSIYELASALDNALRRGDQAAACAALAPLAERLPKLITTLKTSLTEVPREPFAPKAELPAETRRLIAELQELLEAGELRARRLFSDRQEELIAALGSARHQALDQAIRRFAYNDAIQLLDD